MPRPFTCVMTKAKAKTIAQKKFEAMMEEKKREEDAADRCHLRHKPIPPEVLIPRYQTIMEAEQARRAQVRAQSMQLTKRHEAPFSFWEKEKERLARR